MVPSSGGHHIFYYQGGQSLITPYILNGSITCISVASIIVIRERSLLKCTRGGGTCMSLAMG